MNSFGHALRKKFIAGLIVSIPTFVSVILIIWLFRIVDDFMSPLYENLFGRHIYGLGFLSALLLIFIAGVISTNVFGKKIVRGVERYLMNIPVFKSVYSPIKSVMDAFSNSSTFTRFVVVEYPRQGVYCFGFLTKETTVKACADGKCETLVAVYMPTNHLYLGETALFNERDVFYTDISVENGIKIVLSGGIATPHTINEIKR